MPEFKKAYVTIMVADLDKSVEFYNGLLGLYEDLRFGDSWAELVTKGITIGLHPKKIGAEPNSGTVAGSGALAGHNQSQPPGLRAEGQVAHPNSGTVAGSGALAGHNQSQPPGLRAEGQVAHPNSGTVAGSGALAGHNQSQPPGLRAEGQVAHLAPEHNHISIGFEVRDLRKTAKELEAKGILFQYQENEVNILAFFKDPDGTHLYLTQVR